jgi:hypothetical protein
VDRTDALTAPGPATPLEAGTPTATQTEQLFLFSDEKAATKAMRAMRLMPHCGLLMAPIGLGYPDRDALGYDGFLGADGKSVERADQAVRSVKMTLIRRGNAIWLRSTQMSGIGYGGYTTGAVDVPTELCSVLGLCQPSGTPPS